MKNGRITLALILLLALSLCGAALADFGLTLPTSLKTVEAEAFMNDRSLDTVRLPDGLTRIERRAFAHSSVSRVDLPKSVSFIADDAFDDCAGLRFYVYADTYAETWAVAHGVAYRYRDSAPATPSHSGSFQYYIRNGACTITGFYGSDTTLDIPAELGGAPVVAVEKGAFERYSFLTAVTLPASLRRIGEGAFALCSGLESIDVPADSQLTTIDDEAFMGCQSLKRFDLPASVTYIGAKAFAGCKLMEVFDIPESSALVTLGDNAFTFSDALKEIRLPASVSDISTGFQNMKSLETVTIAAGSKITAIKDNAFNECPALKRVDIPAGITRIGNNAFYNCKALEDIDLSNATALSSIGEYAFYYCEALEDVDLSNVTALTSVGEYAFYYCKALKRIDLSKDAALSSIGTNAFYVCSSLESVRLNDDVALTAIEPYTFESCVSLSDFRIPKGVKTIGRDAFSSCNALTEMDIPESVTEIGIAAFDFCQSLATVTLHEGLETIGTCAFQYCTRLRELVVPDSVTTLGDSFVKYDSALTRLELGGGVPAPTKQQLIGLSDVQSNLQTLVLREGVTTLEDSLFANFTKLKDVTLPESLETIGESAFTKCTSLPEIRIPEGVTVIPAYAFQGCTALAEVELPEGLTTIGNYAFSRSGLPEVRIPASVTEISTGAFCYCASLRYAELSQGLVTLGNYAFSDCDVLEEMRVPDSVTSLGKGFIENDLALTTLELGGGVPEPTVEQYHLTEKYGASPALQTLILREGITSLPDYAFGDKSKSFSYYKQLTDVELPESLTTIGDYAFANCVSLRSLRIPDGVTSLGEGVVLGDLALVRLELGGGIPEPTVAQLRVSNNISALRTLVIHEGVKSLPDYAFSSFPSLTNVTLPESLNTLGEYAFKGCASLKQISLPDAITVINAYTFSGCAALENVKLPKRLTSIEAFAFSDCAALKSLELPGTLTAIGSSAFSGCKALEAADIPASVTTIDSSAYSGCAGLRTVYLREGLVTIGDAAFSGCTALESLSVPDSVTSLGNGFISGDTGLKSLELGGGVPEPTVSQYKIVSNYEVCGLESLVIREGVTSLSKYAFSYAFSDSSINQRPFAKLKFVSLPASLNSIGDYAFDHCDSLETVQLREGLTTIGTRAFSNCPSLKSMSVPDSVTSLGNDFLLGDLGLEYLELGGGIEKPTLAQLHLSSIATYESALRSLVVRDGVTALPDYAYSSVSNSKSKIYNCAYPNLTTVSLPDSLTSLGIYTFRNDTSLESVRMSSAVTSIGFTVFYNCDKLTTIYGTPGTYAETWALENGYTFVDMASAVETAEFSLADGVIYLGVGQTYTPDVKASVPILGVIYTSSNPSVLDASGGANGSPVWTARAWGKATVTAEIIVSVENPFLNRTASAEVVVCLDVLPDPVEIEVGESVQLRPSMLNVYGAPEINWVDGDWSISDVNIASFEYGLNTNADETPDIIGKAPGTTVVTFTPREGDLYVSVPVTVTASRFSHAVSQEEYYQRLQALESGANPLDDEVIYDTLYQALYDLFGGDANAYDSHAFARKVLSCLNSATDTYRDIYIYSFFEYDKTMNVKSSGTSPDSQYKSSLNRLDVYRDSGIYWEASFSWLPLLSTWFHESGHAVDFNASGSDIQLTDVYADAIAKCLESECTTTLVSLMDQYCAAFNKDIDTDETMAIIDAIYDYRNCDTMIQYITDTSFDIQINPPQGIDEAYTDDYMGFVEYCCEKLSEKWFSGKENDRYYRDNSNGTMFSDVMSGMTNNAVHGTNGHGKPWNEDMKLYWFNKKGVSTKNQSREAWAEYFASNLLKGQAQEAYDTNREFNYSSTAYFDKVIAPQMLDYLKDMVQSR